ncbi:MAG: UDP-glucose--hexose-1-phosphate uridylyltransferase [Elusimicrobiota bacterium]
MPELDLNIHPHRRLNQLTGDWVLVSPHRAARPWQGQVEKAAVPPKLRYDPTCYLCPGNARAGGARNPSYRGVYAFDNDFAALLPDTPAAKSVKGGGLLVARGEPGVSKVLCFSPRHDLTLSRMDRPAVRAVVDTWAAEYKGFCARPGLNYVQIFENRGEMMGCSNPHPHCQIWATATVPNEPAREQRSFRRYRASGGRCLLCDYLARELSAGERVVCSNRLFTALVPFWAVWPFETLVIGSRHRSGLDRLGAEEKDGLADILRRLTGIYDRVFGVPFPYSMGFHQRPTDGREHPEWHLHAHFYPPLLRSAAVRKFMVGYELLAAPQRDITPEAAAERLRSLDRP